MNIRILGTESLGVRGLSCIVTVSDRTIFIDPGIALGWSRHGLLPHPFQVAVGQTIRNAIIRELAAATDIVFSHFHGDHCPLLHPNPFQLGIEAVEHLLTACRIRANAPENCAPMELNRRRDMENVLGQTLCSSEQIIDGPLEFSVSVPHGRRGEKTTRVMMTKITDSALTFIHASDIQFLDAEAIEIIKAWSPDIVLASGPPLYIFSGSGKSYRGLRQIARTNALDLSAAVDTLILDHHLLRSNEGIAWLKTIQQESDHRVVCAAEFMQRQPLFFESLREKLYAWVPVPSGWHEAYSRGEEDIEIYRIKGWKALIEHDVIAPCQWYSVCPIKQFTDAGRLDRYWVENYCLVGNTGCVRYAMEERGEYHPDSMLPNGEMFPD